MRCSCGDGPDIWLLLACSICDTGVGLYGSLEGIGDIVLFLLLCKTIILLIKFDVSDTNSDQHSYLKKISILIETLV